VEAHRFRRDFLISSRAGADLPTRPEPLLPFWIGHDHRRTCDERAAYIFDSSADCGTFGLRKHFPGIEEKHQQKCNPRRQGLTVGRHNETARLQDKNRL
jgi:hypothetical protein